MIMTMHPSLSRKTQLLVKTLVNFDMQAESGRLIVGVKLSDEIRNTFFSNFVYVQHQVKYADGTLSGWSGMTQFNDLQKDKLLTFYFSDNDKSITGACVEFKFTICDALTGPYKYFF